MATHIEDVYEDLLLALRAALTHVDLSTTSDTYRVIVDGSAPMPVSPPWLVLGPPQDLTAIVDELGHRHYRVTFNVHWAGCVAADADNTYVRTLRAAELVSDVIEAINAAWQVTGGTYAFLYQCVSIVHRVPVISGGSSAEGVSMAGAEGDIEITYSSLEGI